MVRSHLYGLAASTPATGISRLAGERGVPVAQARPRHNCKHLRRQLVYIVAGCPMCGISEQRSNILHLNIVMVQ